MANPWLMGIDIGGSGVRCLLHNSASGERFAAAHPLSVSKAPGTFGTGYDFDTQVVWQVLGKTCRDAVAAAGIDNAAIEALAISAVRFSTVVVSHDGEILLSATNRDARAAGECFELADQSGDKWLAETGSWPLPLHAAPRLMQMRNANTLTGAATVYGIGEWLNEQLCGARCMDPTQASATGLYSLKGNDWCWQLIDELALPREIFPEVRPAGSALGQLSDAAAAHLGLAEGATVALGAGDSQASLLGAGAIQPGDCTVVGGTTAPVQQVMAEPAYDPTGAMIASHHALPGLWVMESNAGPMGESITMMARTLFPQAAAPELHLFAEAERSEPGAGGMLSTLGAEIMNMQAPSMPIGQLSMSPMTFDGSSSPAPSVARAVVEGCCCALRANTERFQATTNILTLSGGLSQSAVFAQLLADISALPVKRTTEHRTTALGAAICAAVAARMFDDIPEACAKLAASNQSFSAKPEHAQTNAQLYANWTCYQQQAAAATAPVAMEHLLPRVLVEPEHTGTGDDGSEQGLSAHVSASFDEASLSKLREHMEVQYASFREVHKLLTGPDLVSTLQGRQVFVTEVDVLDVDALAQLPDLRVVAACRGDAVNVDVDACSAFGIPVLFAPGRNAVAVADLTVAFMLSLSRKLGAASTFLQQEDVTAGNMGKMGQAFKQFQGHELWHKTVGLVGLGAVGRAVARRLAGFDVEILVADPFVTPEQAALAGCRLVELDTLLASSDFVSLHAAVTPQTTGMIGAEQLALMRPGAFLVNTARAALVDEDALIQALQSEQIAGAALDTFAVEPPGFDHPLVQHPAVLCTPHSAGNTVEVADHQGESVSSALLQLLRGETPSCVLNPQALENFSWDGPKPTPSDAEIEQLRNKGGPAVSDLQRDARSNTTDSTPDLEVAAPEDIINKMTEILEGFCAGMASDDGLAEFSQDQEVTLHFTVIDLGLQFFIKLQRGRVDSALGAPEDGAEVQLQMRAEILDGMFTGTIDSMECAMNGEISFMGDAAKAMTLQHMNEAMERLYSAAREQAGGPGDLASVPRPSSAAPPPATLGPDDVREDLVAIMQELYESQVITATGGNISVRIPDTDDELWITPSRLFKGDLKPEVMVRINLQGESLDTRARSPSSEWCMHTEILKRKSQAKAVIHAHAPNATILANAGLPFLPISTEAAFFGDIARVPFIMPGTPELAEAVADAMGEDWAVLLVNHGIIVGGRTLRRAADMVEIIERTAEVILGCHAVGKEPPLLPEDAAQHFRKLGDVVA